MLLAQVKERAKHLGLELKGRLFIHENLCPSSTKHKTAEKENIFKVIKLENKINAQIEITKDEQKEINGKLRILHCTITYLWLFLCDRYSKKSFVVTSCFKFCSSSEYKIQAILKSVIIQDFLKASGSFFRLLQSI